MTSGYDTGQSVNVGSVILAPPMIQISNTSGGTTLPNQPCVEITLENVSGNTPMFVGGIGSLAANSGIGYQLYGGNSLSRRIDNFNKVSVFATASGQFLAIIGTG